MSLPELQETLAAPDPEEAIALELDELWSFVLKRANKRWVWVALCRATRQVVAYAVGDRSRATCQKLWAAIPAAYRRAHCFSGFREAYQLVVPAEQHTAALRIFDTCTGGNQSFILNSFKVDVVGAR